MIIASLSAQEKQTAHPTRIHCQEVISVCFGETYDTYKYMWKFDIEITLNLTVGKSDSPVRNRTHNALSVSSI